MARVRGAGRGGWYWLAGKGGGRRAEAGDDCRGRGRVQRRRWMDVDGVGEEGVGGQVVVGGSGFPFPQWSQG